MRKGARAEMLGWRTRKKLAPLLFIAPALVCFAFFMFYSIFFAGWVSLNQWQLIGGGKYVGLMNYLELAVDRTVVEAIKVTFLYVIAYVPLIVLLPLFIAILLDLRWRVKGESLFKIMILLPSITPLLAMGLVWRYIYSFEYGVINYYLSLLGFEKVPWLNSFSLALPSVLMTSIWHATGWNMIILLAGLRNIPEEYHEAAKIDGANGWNVLRYITLPLLKPILLFVVIMVTIAAFKTFALIWGLTQGGPGTATTTLMVKIYLEAFVKHRLGMGSALTFLLLAIVLGLAIVQMRVLRSESNY